MFGLNFEILLVVKTVFDYSVFLNDKNTDCKITKNSRNIGFFYLNSYQQLPETNLNALVYCTINFFVTEPDGVVRVTK